MMEHGVSGTPVNRRQFIGTAAAFAGISIVPRHVVARSGQRPPGEKLNIGCVGVGGMQGASDVGSVSGENIYALCDVDENFLNKAAEKYPQARKYRDFREMLDKEHRNLDGITITIPDHMHATVALWAMERGLHVYCQKPLTQSVWEARLMQKAARKYKVVTQMGNQGYSSEATRIACEIIWNGDLGDIREVHAMHGGGFARGIREWDTASSAPATLNWDLWTGRAPDHPYSPKIHPSNWRGFQDYGTQMVGDWGIHILGPANWGLQLDHPASVECIGVEDVNPVTYPHYACRFEFPERPNPFVKGGRMPPVTLYWYEGQMTKLFNAPKDIYDPAPPPPKPDAPGAAGQPKPPEPFKFNQLFIGSKGYMGTAGRGESVRLMPESRMKEFRKPPAVLKRSPGHFQNWIQACKNGGTTCSDFGVGGAFTEWLLLGAISWRFPNRKLLWDGRNLRFTNDEKANEFIKPHFRKGWELKDIAV